MSRIAIPGRDDAPAESQPILDNVNKMLGFVPSLQRLMSISPEALFIAQHDSFYMATVSECALNRTTSLVGRERQYFQVGLSSGFRVRF
jgi:hypothetical protein